MTDALFMARRYIDNANAKTTYKLALLPLDWAKAFDSIMLDAMINALKRFSFNIIISLMNNMIYDAQEFYAA